MTILLYKDGRLVIDDGNPIEGNSLEGLVACVTDPQSGDTLKFDGKQWVAGAAASGLPDVSGDDNGKVLTVVEGEWAPAAGGGGGGGGGALLVEVADDGAEYTMDKTANEIVTALAAGKPIICKLSDSDNYEHQYGSLLASAAQYNNKTHELIDITFYVTFNETPFQMIASSMDGYPSYYYAD